MHKELGYENMKLELISY